MNKQLKASFIISLMLITIVSAVFNANAVSDSNRMYIGNSGSPPVANFTIHNDGGIGYVIFDGSSSYDIDGEIVLYTWNFGDGTSFESQWEWIYNQYCEQGFYNVTLTVTDNDGLMGNLTKPIYIVFTNTPPPYAVIYGPESGNTGTDYKYHFEIYYEEADIYLLVDWGDGNNTGWISVLDYYVDLSHTWSEEGKYTIRAKAKDDCRDGPWTEFEVKMPRDKAFTYSLLQRWIEHYPLLNRLLNFIQ